MSDPQPETDPRVDYLGSILDRFWDDESIHQSVHLEAVTAVDALDNWDRQNGVQRATAAFIEQLQAEVSKARAALEAAVLAFEFGGKTTAENLAGEPVGPAILHAEIPETTVARWRAIAEGVA